MDMDVLEQALANTNSQLIDQVRKDVLKGQCEVDYIAEPGDNDVVIDIRHPDEVSQKPLQLGSEKMQSCKWPIGCFHT